MGGYYFAVMDIAPAFVGIIQGINKTVSFYFFFFHFNEKVKSFLFIIYIT